MTFYVIMKPYFVVGIVCCALSLIAHILSLVVLLKTEKLRKKKFFKLVISLSVSDVFFLLIYIYSLVNSSFTKDILLQSYQRLVLSNLVGGILLFSFIQTFIVCLELFNAMCLPKKNVLDILTSNKSCLIAFIFCQCLTGFEFICILSIVSH